MTAPNPDQNMQADDKAKAKMVSKGPIVKMKVLRPALVKNCTIIRTDGEKLEADERGLVADEGQIVEVDEKQAKELEKVFSNTYAFSGTRSNEDAVNGIGKIQKAIRL